MRIVEPFDRVERLPEHRADGHAVLGLARGDVQHVVFRDEDRRGGTAAAGCTGPVQATVQQTAIRLAVGPPLLRDAHRKLLPHDSFEIVATGGSVTQLEAVQNGSADVGNAMADVAYLAPRGQL